MALTGTQKASVRRYLGYPDVNRETYLGLEGAMDAISAEGEVIVADILAQIVDLDATLRSSWSRQKVKRAEEVELWGGDEILNLRMEGARLAGELAALLDVQILRNVFSSGAGSVGIAGRG